MFRFAEQRRVGAEDELRVIVERQREKPIVGGNFAAVAHQVGNLDFGDADPEADRQRLRRFRRGETVPQQRDAWLLILPGGGVDRSVNEFLTVERGPAGEQRPSVRRPEGADIDIRLQLRIPVVLRIVAVSTEQLLLQSRGGLSEPGTAEFRIAVHRVRHAPRRQELPGISGAVEHAGHRGVSRIGRQRLAVLGDAEAAVAVHCEPHLVRHAVGEALQITADHEGRRDAAVGDGAQRILLHPTIRKAGQVAVFTVVDRFFSIFVHEFAQQRDAVVQPELAGHRVVDLRSAREAV